MRRRYEQQYHHPLPNSDLIKRHVDANYHQALEAGGNFQHVMEMDFQELLRNPLATARLLGEEYHMPGVRVGGSGSSSRIADATGTDTNATTDELGTDDHLALTPIEEARRRKEMRLVLSVEQAAAVLKRFKKIVPFIQTLERVVHLKLPNVARGFYLWRGAAQAYARIKRG